MQEKLMDETEITKRKTKDLIRDIVRNLNPERQAIFKSIRKTLNEMTDKYGDLGALAIVIKAEEILDEHDSRKN